MDSRFLTWVLFCKLVHVVTAQSPYIRCFQKTIRRSVDNAQPMTELFYVTPYQCMDQCIAATNNHAPKARLCRSFIYDHLQHSCRLYEHDGNEPPAIIHPANGFDYYRRTAVLNQCAGPGSPQDGPLPMEATGNPNFYRMKKAHQKIKTVDPYQGAAPSASTKRNEQTASEGYITGAVENELYSGRATEKKPVRPAAPKASLVPASDELSPEINPQPEVHPLFPQPKKVAVPKKPISPPPTKSATTPPIKYVTELINEVNSFDTVPLNPTRPKKVRPNSTAGLPAGNDQVVHLPNSASELGYESPKVRKPKKHRSTTPPPFEPEEHFVPGRPFQPATFRPTTSKSSVQHTAPPPPPTHTIPSSTAPPKTSVSSADCATSTAYYVVIGNEIILPISGAENNVKVIQGIEQSQCAKHCTSNKGPRGEHIKCSSINYFPVTQKCEMYSILAEPHGPGNLVENDDVIYSEKFCLPPSQADCQDDEIFLLQVQKKVVGRQISTTSASSITNCLRSCLNARGCLIASYDSNRNRCSLHSMDIGENPNAVQDAEPGWVLIENGCSGKRRKPSSILHGVSQHSPNDGSADTKWTEWSDCQFRVHGSMVRVRTRQCEADCPDGGMQLEKC
ncbi:hypothetical protein L596_004067 [Steinernema carpocapsae]|uniref:Apple domain-containing protein n=1 Tax=Steinernema carpocapsae TaxID=34508 RepID=A0A4U8UYP8_STECR|nr:hypothetical protein L596_004067 [Steinernema carpocapsae]